LDLSETGLIFFHIAGMILFQYVYNVSEVTEITLKKTRERKKIDAFKMYDLRVYL